jgi:hypothetical protein
VTSIMQDREIAELRAALEVARRDEADAATRAKVAEARVEVLLAEVAALGGTDASGN